MLRKFFVLTFLFSWIITGTIALQTHGIIPFVVIPAPVGWLAGLIPGLVALSLVSGKKEFLANCLKSGVSIQAVFIILCLTFGVLGVVYWFYELIDRSIEIDFSLDSLLLQFFIWGMLAFGEEVGWRGFALPALTRPDQFLRRQFFSDCFGVCGITQRF